MSAPAKSQLELACALQNSEDIHLEGLIRQTPPGFLRPMCFFISWQGVMTLAYSGFPDNLLALKARMAEHYPTLPKEAPGSLWPKTTLGALRDNRRLTPEQLKDLIAMCKEESAAMLKFMQSVPIWLKVPVQSAAVAVYLCRSLERLLSYKEVAMEGTRQEPLPPPIQQVQILGLEDDEDASGLNCDEDGMDQSGDTIEDEHADEEDEEEEEEDGGEEEEEDGGEKAGAANPLQKSQYVDLADRDIGVSGAEKERMRKIVAECDGKDYWFAASKDGSRESHYRGPALGCTLMIPFGRYVKEGRDYAPSELFAFITMFQERVDARFPGLYSWLSLEAAHVTLRGIIS